MNKSKMNTQFTSSISTLDDSKVFNNNLVYPKMLTMQRDSYKHINSIELKSAKSKKSINYYKLDQDQRFRI